MKFTQFVKDYLAKHPEVKLTYREAMKDDGVRCAYKQYEADLCKQGVVRETEKRPEPKRKYNKASAPLVENITINTDDVIEKGPRVQAPTAPAPPGPRKGGMDGPGGPPKPPRYGQMASRQQPEPAFYQQNPLLAQQAVERYRRQAPPAPPATPSAPRVTGRKGRSRGVQVDPAAPSSATTTTQTDEAQPAPYVPPPLPQFRQVPPELQQDIQRGFGEEGYYDAQQEEPEPDAFEDAQQGPGFDRPPEIVRQDIARRVRFGEEPEQEFFDPQEPPQQDPGDDEFADAVDPYANFQEYYDREIGPEIEDMDLHNVSDDELDYYHRQVNEMRDQLNPMRDHPYGRDEVVPDQDNPLLTPRRPSQTSQSPLERQARTAITEMIGYTTNADIEQYINDRIEAENQMEYPEPVTREEVLQDIVRRYEEYKRRQRGEDDGEEKKDDDDDDDDDDFHDPDMPPLEDANAPRRDPEPESEAEYEDEDDAPAEGQEEELDELPVEEYNARLLEMSRAQLFAECARRFGEKSRANKRNKCAANDTDAKLRTRLRKRRRREEQQQQQPGEQDDGEAQDGPPENLQEAEEDSQFAQRALEESEEDLTRLNEVQDAAEKWEDKILSMTKESYESAFKTGVTAVMLNFLYTALRFGSRKLADDYVNENTDYNNTAEYAAATFGNAMTGGAFGNKSNPLFKAVGKVGTNVLNVRDLTDAVSPGSFDAYVAAMMGRMSYDVLKPMVIHGGPLAFKLAATAVQIAPATAGAVAAYTAARQLGYKAEDIVPLQKIQESMSSAQSMLNRATEYIQQGLGKAFDYLPTVTTRGSLANYPKAYKILKDEGHTDKDIRETFLGEPVGEVLMRGAKRYGNMYFQGLNRFQNNPYGLGRGLKDDKKEKLKRIMHELIDVSL